MQIRAAKTTWPGLQGCPLKLSSHKCPILTAVASIWRGSFVGTNHGSEHSWRCQTQGSVSLQKHVKKNGGSDTTQHDFGRLTSLGPFDSLRAPERPSAVEPFSLAAMGRRSSGTLVPAITTSRGFRSVGWTFLWDCEVSWA